jgi:hypothetical protein
VRFVATGLLRLRVMKKPLSGPQIFCLSGVIQYDDTGSMIVWARFLLRILFAIGVFMATLMLSPIQGSVTTKQEPVNV